MFKISELKDGKLLNFQSLKMRDVVELIKLVNEMFSKGYVLEDEFIPRTCPQIPRIFNLKFVKKDTLTEEVSDNSEIISVVEEKEEETININDLTKTEELTEFAEKRDIEIPEEVTHPASIKKYIKDHMGIK